MREKWILEVLADMRVFALANDLGALADALEQTSDVANRELGMRAKTCDRTGDVHVPVEAACPFELR